MNKAFSFIELLIVISIILIAVTITTVSTASLSASSKITLAAETVIGSLTNARQIAATKWRDVEVRIITMPNTKFPSSGALPRALQLIEISESGKMPLGKPRMLPDNTIVSPDTSLSTIMSLSPVSASHLNGDPPLPGVGHSYQYRAFRFRPDGSSNLNMLLTNTKLFQMTVVAENAPVSSGNPPPNFATIQIVPATGASFLYRP
jgi:uncharacterized protein (TIGR02596 family)